ncbi:MAG TPA: TIGR02281 family clan AA aspartic protease [Sphingomonas sp.]|nr:TIGR02281 family clan AA aspartic protease [Sphingomonas sp.]
MKLVLLLFVVTGIGIGVAIPVARPQVVATAGTVVEAPGRPVETVLDRSGGGHFYTAADVNDEPIRFLVDTGASTVALTIEDARRAHVAFDPAQFTVIGKGASGDVRGQAVRIASVVLDGKRATDISGVVLESSNISLLGQSYLRHVDTVEIKGDRMRLR